ncbi:MAG: efflux RND transporter periplasmic adaptor subunit [Candidatus Delongbacteria bacterium]|jgi:HlyD family secretion protein|nr:efflux RND transporter periplasmic adaptor subunit [Candidatus Delongbacteria bacterium]
MKKIIITLFIFLLMQFISCSKLENNSDLTFEVKNGPFIVSITETGEIRAKNSVVVTTPRSLRSTAKILEIIPEGSIVQKGDFLLQFDADNVLKEIESIQTELDGLNSDIEKSDANHQFLILQAELDLENADTSYKLAKMRLKQIEFESQSRQEEEKLSFKISENSYTEVKERLKLQKITNASERSALMSRHKRVKLKLEQKEDELNNLRIIAPENGLVVYSKIWKGSRWGKLQVGDTPWRGQALIELPDLSEMEIETSVNEVDISKINIGMKVNIQLDAYREKTYQGEIVDIARLARNSDLDEDIKIFDVTIKVIGADEKMKPGMTSKCDIIINEYENVDYLPVEALFSEDSLSFVYVKDKIGYHKEYLEIIDKNDIHVAVKGKIAEENIYLYNPENGKE